MPRTRADFSKHELTIQENPLVTIFTLQIPNSYTYSVKFILCCDVTTITGDFGNYVVNRLFAPSPEGYVSDSYWIEKIRAQSCQEPLLFDQEETESRIDEAIAEIESDLQHSEDCIGDSCDEELKYLKDLREVVWQGGEESYLDLAYNSLPDGWDFEDIPVGKELVDYLPQVFDAFEEMCRIMKEGKYVHIKT